MNDSQVTMRHHKTSRISGFSSEKQVSLGSSGYAAN